MVNDEIDLKFLTNEKIKYLRRRVQEKKTFLNLISKIYISGLKKRKFGGLQK